ATNVREPSLSEIAWGSATPVSYKEFSARRPSGGPRLLAARFLRGRHRRQLPPARRHAQPRDAGLIQHLTVDLLAEARLFLGVARGQKQADAQLDAVVDDAVDVDVHLVADDQRPGVQPGPQAVAERHQLPWRGLRADHERGAEAAVAAGAHVVD